MDFKINREMLPVTECVYEGIQEQSIGLDYILPDYYPDIFRIIRCEAFPVITDYTVSGDRIAYELACDLRIHYCSEGSSMLQCVSQRQFFSKTLELSTNCENITAVLTAKPDHFNCRAVNKRRLDLRGAVSVKIRAEGERSCEVISDAEGMNIQLKKIPVSYASKRLNAEKLIQLTEETELSSAAPSVVGIVSSRCRTAECDKKLISGKLLAKGEAEITVLYSCERDGEGSLEQLAFPVSFSQVMDMDGLDESFDCSISAEPVRCDIVPVADKNGENRILKCELELKIVCTAIRTASVMLAADAYSTTYPCETVSSRIRAQQLPVMYTETIRHTARICEGEDIPQTVYTMQCTPKNINTRLSENGRGLVISGMLTYTMTAKDKSGMIVIPDKDEAFEETVDTGDDIRGKSFGATVDVSGVSYNISADNVLTAKAELTVHIRVCGAEEITALTDIIIDDSTKKLRDGDYAIKLYYGVENEEIWDIAKRYSTSAQAVMEENDLASDRLESGGMLIIPIKN